MGMCNAATIATGLVGGSNSAARDCGDSLFWRTAQSIGFVDGQSLQNRRSTGPRRPALDQEKLNAAVMLVKGGMSPTRAVNRLSGNSKPTWRMSP
jgi:hypothetical protein